MEEKKRISSFDALKGLVVLITVTIGHYWQFTPGGYYANGSNETWVQITNTITRLSFKKTYSFMELLLMISGFQLYSYYERINRDEIGFGEYFKKRAKRLIPVAAISSLIMFIGLGVFYDSFGEYWHNMAPTPSHLVENMLLIQSWVNPAHSLNGPLWYVSVYFFCTILFYFLARIDKKHGGLFFMALPIILGIGLTNSKCSLVLLNADMRRGYISFFLGVLIAELCKRLSDRKAYCYSAAAIVFFMILYHFDGPFFYNGDVLDKSIPTMFLLYAPMLIILSKCKPLDMIIGNPVLTGLGKVSYELCALNFPFYVWLEICNRKFSWNIPYGNVPSYYIIAAAQVALAVGLGFLKKAVLHFRDRCKSA